MVLTGEGADEVFAGYDMFKEARVRRFCARQPTSRIRPHLFRKLYPYLPGLRQQSVEYLAAFFGAGDALPNDPLFSHRPRFKTTAATKIFFSGELRETLKGYDAADDLVSRLPAEFSAGTRSTRRNIWRAASCCRATFCPARATAWRWRMASRAASPSSIIGWSNSRRGSRPNEAERAGREAHIAQGGDGPASARSPGSAPSSPIAPRTASHSPASGDLDYVDDA